MTIIESIKVARRTSVPLVIIRTADPGGTEKSIAASYGNKPVPMIEWDIVRGAYASNKPGADALNEMLNKPTEMDQSGTTNLPEFLERARTSLPEQCIIFVHNLHRYMSDTGAVQALCNLRDYFKTDSRTLIGLVPDVTLPSELTQDVLVLDEPLPDDKQLTAIAESIYESASLDKPTGEVTERIIDATLGLAAFPAEQSMAMSIRQDGMDIAELWSRKRSLIQQTPGLTVWAGGETFADIGGCDNIKSFLRDVLNGNNSPRAVVFIDEIEKAIGSGNDTSGVSQSMLGTVLTWMQDKSASGCLFIGPPGAAKSAIAKACGNEGGIPTIATDMGAMKDSLVGASEARMRQALKVIDAVSQNRALVIATCNSISNLPPELRRRFTFGVFAFGLPEREERQAIWEIYRNKFSIDAGDPGISNDEGWTGAEIKQCCELAYRLKRTLEACSAFIVPVSVSAAEQINRLGEQADGKFISASHAGLYRHKRPALEAPKSSARAITFDR